MSNFSTPLEIRSLKLHHNGLNKEVAALHSNWAVKDRTFVSYIKHPRPNRRGQFELGAKESWIQMVTYFTDDVRHLLELKHHRFWSTIVYTDIRKILLSFLQEAPPFYLLDEFPNDEEMLKLLKTAERLVYLVLVRLATIKESNDHFLTKQHFSELIYDNFLFSIPILFDLCLHYGRNNSAEVSKIIKTVFDAQPLYADDLNNFIPFIIQNFDTVGDRFFGEDELASIRAGEKLRPTEIKDLFIYLFDSVTTIQIFLNCYPEACPYFHVHGLEIKILNFYQHTMPSMYETIENIHEVTEYKKFLDSTRLELLKIFKSMLMSIINEVLDDNSDATSLVDKYLDIVTEAFSFTYFIQDYCNMYSIDADIDCLMQACPTADPVKIDFVLDGIKTYTGHVAVKPKREVPISKNQLLKQIKDVFPDENDEFLDQCLEYYHNNVEQILSAILENNLPPSLVETRERRPQPSTPTVDPNALPKKHKSFKEFYNDKSDLGSIKDLFSNYAVSDKYTYDDEYDDTYEGVDVSVKEEDEERRPFVVPRILAKYEKEESESEEEEEPQPQTSRDQFVANPAEIRAKYERRYEERTRGDVVGKKKGQGQEKNVLINRQKKNAHKGSSANHNRRDMASRKRNQGMF